MPEQQEDVVGGDYELDWQRKNIQKQKEKETLRNVFQFSVKYSSLIIVPVAFAVIALSQQGVSTFFGQKYAFAPIYLALYVVPFIYAVFGNLNIDILIQSQGRTDINMKLTLITSGIALCLNLILIPAFGIMGFLVTNFISGIPSLIISIWWIKKKFSTTIDWISSTKILLTCILATIITYFLTAQLNFANWILLIIGVMIFLTVILTTAPLLGAIKQNDVKNIKDAIQGLGRFTTLFNIPLSYIELLIRIFSRN